MELHYIKIDHDLSKLQPKDTIYFLLPHETLKYVVSSCGRFCWLNININDSNEKIFNLLGLKSEIFVENIVGYKCPKGAWPVVSCIDDLKKVIKALDDECVKKFENPDTPKFKIGDKVRILPRKDKPENYIGVYIDEMLHYAGEIAYIRLINSDSSIILEGNSCTWDPKALELVNEKEESKTMDINQAKDGDYICITNKVGTKYIVLFKDIKEGYVTRYASYSLFTYKFNFNPKKSYDYWGELSRISTVNYATKEEKQLLDSKLLEIGYRWNNSTKEIEAIDLPNTPTNIDKSETQFEAKLNLFPTKKHYQLNFNY